MTLSPIFRDEESIEFLSKQGYLEKFLPALELQKQARSKIEQLVKSHYECGGSFEPAEDIEIFKRDFFLIFFSSISTNGRSKHVEWYAPWNYCIRGTITAADNLLDNENKKTLPLDEGISGVIRSCVELKMHEQLMAYLGREIPLESYELIKRRLDNKILEIGKLENSEEKGVEEIMKPDEMIQKVHYIRGGALFELGMIAPLILEPELKDYWKKAKEGIIKIGTAFQIVDDITDFEADLVRNSHNILRAEICHNAKPSERCLLFAVKPGEKRLVETYFKDSARSVAEYAYCLAREGFIILESIGFWYKPEHTEQFVNAILGNMRMKEIFK
jgi:hypothetical protein